MLAPPPRAHRSPVTLNDLLADLLWPHLLRSWKLALAPGRIALCLVLLIVGALVIATLQGLGKHNALGNLWQDVANDLSGVAGSLKDPQTAVLSLYSLFVEVPWNAVRAHPVAVLVGVPTLLAIWSLAGTAVCRSAACEVSLRAALPWRSALAFGLRKTPAVFAALAGPVLAVWIACLTLKVFGWVFFTSKFMGVIGSAGFVLPLLLALVVAGAAVAYVLAHTLLIPAVACEGTDSFDAIQRCYAYVLARPGRLVGYGLIALLSSFPAIIATAVIIGFALLLAVSLTGAPVGPGSGLTGVSPEEHWRFARFLATFWCAALIAVGAAYVLSLYFCASTSLYLVMRRLVDGQDIAELWTPQALAAAPIALQNTQPPSAAGGDSSAPASLPPERADYT